MARNTNKTDGNIHLPYGVCLTLSYLATLYIVQVHLPVNDGINHLYLHIPVQGSTSLIYNLHSVTYHSPYARYMYVNKYNTQGSPWLW